MERVAGAFLVLVVVVVHHNKMHQMHQIHRMRATSEMFREPDSTASVACSLVVGGTPSVVMVVVDCLYK